ncbi:spindle assembly checkpoint component Mad1 [Diplogelasinospora grovesii]|uniref:Spindle assembly checkpoint component MAD1 n=1 Tax=Diplogelasinospora grovesii TaxID=303347 RepID=A0AAN6S2K9_9PEZI|nr:spindle assembly checkpoint component Mad1 [Diplogelasinospora grovesii]
MPQTPKPSAFDNRLPEMRSFTPQGDPPEAARRASVTGNSQFRRSSNSTLGRPNTSLRESRIGGIRGGTANQPTYNLFTGETSSGNPSSSTTNNMARSMSRQGLQPSGISPPRGRAATTIAGSSYSRDSSKENMAPPDAEEYETQRRRIEELKAEVGTLRYTISNYEQEKELARLQADNEMRETKRRAEEDFKAKQAAESEKAKALRQVEALQSELDALTAEKETQKREMERKTREVQDEVALLLEQLADLSAAKDEAARMAEREITDLNSKVAASQRGAQELEQESRTREEVLERTQMQLAERDETVGRLESEVLRLKAHTGDAETISVLTRELSDQVTHIRTLEAKTREQLTELKHLRQIHKAVEVVEEEKRSLQRRLEASERLQDELDEERRQRQRLEDERRAWAAYLESEASNGNPIEFDSPEDVARALIAERLSSASLVERLGELQPEIADRDNIIKTLENEKASLQSQIEKLKTSGGGASGGNADKARARLERQRALAVKEAEYLRAQLKTFELEDVTMHSESVDQEKAQRIQELEDLVEEYKDEVNALHAELSSRDSTSASNPQPATGLKRPREADEAESEQLGQLSRKNRKLQTDLAELQNAHSLLQKEYDVTSEQLASAKEQLKVRVLSLRSNPTSDYQAAKASTLAALKLENAELVAHIQRQPTLFATVPASQLAAAQREIADAKAETASSQKSARRLKEVWAAKSAEFKEAVFSTLGWTVTFIPGGKMRVESVYYPSQTDEHENSIVFDGERGTMKVGGGPRSAFAMRIGDNIKFWVRERGCVPCFLAALTLEFYEEHTRAVRPS